ADADHAFFNRLQVRFEGPHAVLTATAPDRAGERRAGAGGRGLDESTTRKSHGYLLPPLPGRGRRRGLEHAAEHFGGLLHLFHRAERDARPLFFQRRGVATAPPPLRGAPLT